MRIAFHEAGRICVVKNAWANAVAFTDAMTMFILATVLGMAEEQEAYCCQYLYCDKLGFICRRT